MRNQPFRGSRVIAMLALIAIPLFGQNISAATVTWTGLSATSNSWSDTGNWLANTPPSANGDTIVFDSNSTGRLATNQYDLTFTGLIINVNASFAGGGITINPSVTPVTLDIGSITLASTAASTLTINNANNVSASQTWTLNGNAVVTSATAATGITGTLTISGAAAGSATFNGIIGGTGGLTLGTSNLSTVTFAAASNTYTDITAINSGTLSFSNVAQLNSSASITIAGQNATTNLARLTYASAANGTLTRAISLGTVAGSCVINVPTAGAILIETGAITGGAAAATTGLIVNGAGVLSLENPTHTANSFLGNVVMDGGGLRVIGDNNAGPGDPFLLGGAAGGAGPKDIVIQNGGRLIT